LKTPTNEDGKENEDCGCEASKPEIIEGEKEMAGETTEGMVTKTLHPMIEAIEITSSHHLLCNDQES
jgi:hypothetical protein